MDTSEVMTDTASDTMSVDVPLSEPLVADSIPEEPEAETMSDIGTSSKVRFTRGEKQPALPSRSHLMSELKPDVEHPAETAPIQESKAAVSADPEKAEPRRFKRTAPGYERGSASSDTSSVILEQAWIMKMAGEIATRIYDEKKRDGPNPSGRMWEEQDAPPAYEAAAQ